MITVQVPEDSTSWWLDNAEFCTEVNFSFIAPGPLLQIMYNCDNLQYSLRTVACVTAGIMTVPVSLSQKLSMQDSQPKSHRPPQAHEQETHH